MWEYTIRYLDTSVYEIEDTLNALGQDKWELVQVIEDKYSAKLILKRLKEENNVG